MLGKQFERVVGFAYQAGKHILVSLVSRQRYAGAFSDGWKNFIGVFPKFAFLHIE